MKIFLRILQTIPNSTGATGVKIMFQILNFQRRKLHKLKSVILESKLILQVVVITQQRIFFLFRYQDLRGYLLCFYWSILEQRYLCKALRKW